MKSETPIREERAAERSQIYALVQSLTSPVVFRNLVSDWPLVNKENPIEATRYLDQFDAGHPVTVFSGDLGEGGRIFYTDELEKVNFEQSRIPFGDLAGRLQNGGTETVYMGSTAVEHYFPGLEAENRLSNEEVGASVRLWIGNQTTVAAHYDAMDNIACVCAGRRRFTLFPPEQIGNLYVGPVDFTPAGQSVSLVDLDDPDYARFPKFRDAEQFAQTAVLEPGDAIFIPALWWHHVRGLDAFNILVNHWWIDAPRHVGPPLDALLHALLNIRDLPPQHRSRWKAFFDHYVFEDPDAAAEHIPEARRGVLGELNDDLARRIRASLRNNLNR